MTHVETGQTFFDCYTAHDVSAMLNLCSPTATFRYVPLGESSTGAIQQAAQLWQLYMEAFPDFKTEVKQLIEGKDGAENPVSVRSDILINNAGLMLVGLVEGEDVSDWQRMVDIDLMGLMKTTHAALPVMKEQGGGRIVNIALSAGRIPIPNYAVYNALSLA